MFDKSKLLENRVLNCWNPSHIVVKPFKSFDKTNLPISAKSLGYDLNQVFFSKEYMIVLNLQDQYLEKTSGEVGFLH